jgi:hypothetical protein
MKIVVLDFETGQVHIYPYDENVWEDYIEFLESEEIGLNSNNCQCMTVSNLNLQIH